MRLVAGDDRYVHRAALPELRRFGYDSALCSAIIAVGGVVDLSSRPSIILVIYAIIAEQNIAKLFQAALIPGIFAVVLYSTVIRIVACRNPQLAPILKKRRAREPDLRLFAKVWPALIVILVVLGGIYTGIFTPTEAAGVGVRFLCCWPVSCSVDSAGRISHTA